VQKTAARGFVRKLTKISIFGDLKKRTFSPPADFAREAPEIRIFCRQPRRQKTATFCRSGQIPEIRQILGFLPDPANRPNSGNPAILEIWPDFRISATCQNPPIRPNPEIRPTRKFGQNFELRSAKFRVRNLAGSGLSGPEISAKTAKFPSEPKKRSRTFFREIRQNGTFSGNRPKRHFSGPAKKVPKKHLRALIKG
jgi:hypothetical protein